MGMDNYCPFCENKLYEGDEIIIVTAGSMSWGDKSRLLYCDPYERFGRKPAELILHMECFEDGPQRDETELLAVVLSEHALMWPQCCLCEEPLAAGDEVYMFQEGALERMEVHIQEIARVNEFCAVRAAYSHTGCVGKSAKVWLPKDNGVYQEEMKGIF